MAEYKDSHVAQLIDGPLDGGQVTTPDRGTDLCMVLPNTDRKKFAIYRRTDRTGVATFPDTQQQMECREYIFDKIVTEDELQAVEEPTE